MNTKYSDYERPAVTVDVLIFTIENDELKVLLVKREADPFKDQLSLPGGFVMDGESLEAAARRILKKKTGVAKVYLEQLYTFGEPDRDPRDRVITVTYYALVPWQKLDNSKSNSQAAWFPAKGVANLAFDHQKILSYGLKRLKAKAGYSNIAHGFLGSRFKLSELQKIYEVVLGKKVDKRNFRKKMFSLGFLEETGEYEVGMAHRPARLYRFNNRELVFFA